jgi:hypothetical protein
MQLRDYPLKRNGLLIPGNVLIIVRERGKRVLKHCRHEHNIWVDLGREYLARVIAPNPGFSDHIAEPPREFIRYMGVGIGGDSQHHPAAYTAPLSTAYPPATGSSPGGAGNQFSDDDLTVPTLERPVLFSVSDWLADIANPPTYPISTTLRCDRLFNTADINSVGPYTTVPLSEVGLFLATQNAGEAYGNVYDLSNPPTMIGAGRQTLLAYNTFEAIPKTTSFSLEIQWELRF